MGLFTPTKPRRLQLYLHDNTDIEFIYRDIVGVSATEYNDSKVAKNSWLDYYQTLYYFDGYKSTPADAIQLAYSRHYHLELHNILPDDLRPPDDDKVITPYTTAIAEARAADLARAAKPKTIYEKMTYLLGACVVVEMLIWGLAYALAK